MQQVKQIVWISEACREYSDEELLQLLNKSRANNVRRNVTGLLIYDKKSFLQFMEGDAGTVDNIFQNRIEPSSLHRNVTLLSQRDIEKGISRTGRWASTALIAENYKAFLDSRNLSSITQEFMNWKAMTIWLIK